MKSQDQVARMLAIVPMVQAREVTISELARTFQVSPKQILADLETLYMCGLPGGYPDDLIEIDLDAAHADGVVRLSNADYLTRPMRLSPDEVTFLQVALLVLLEIADQQHAQAARSALEKLTALSGAVTQPAQVQVMLATGDEQIRSQLLAHIDARERVQLTYDRADGQTTSPLVDPARIELRDGVAYLQAWSLARNAWRTFRIDRIVAVTPTGELAADHGAVPELGDWFVDETERTTLRLTKQAAWVAEYFPSFGLVQLADDAIELTLPVSDPAWLTSLLLRLADQAEVIEPESAATAVVAQARAALSNY